MNRSGGQTDEASVVRRTPGSSSLTVEIVRAVAAVENTEPQSLPPLGNVVDPEAIEAVLDGAESAAHLTFSYAGRRVVVTGETVEVYYSSH